jgi:hypothetical protein
VEGASGGSLWPVEGQDHEKRESAVCGQKPLAAGPFGHVHELRQPEPGAQESVEVLLKRAVVVVRFDSLCRHATVDAQGAVREVVHDVLADDRRLDLFVLSGWRSGPQNAVRPPATKRGMPTVSMVSENGRKNAVAKSAIEKKRSLNECCIVISVMRSPE